MVSTTSFTEKLAEVEGRLLSRETIRRMLRDAGPGSPRKRRPPKLHYVRKVHRNHTVRINGRVIDIPKRQTSAHATYAGKDVVVNICSEATTASFTAMSALLGLCGSRP